MEWDEKWNLKATLWNIFAKLEVIDSYQPYCNKVRDEKWFMSAVTVNGRKIYVGEDDEN